MRKGSEGKKEEGGEKRRRKERERARSKRKQNREQNFTNFEARKNLERGITLLEVLESFLETSLGTFLATFW